MLNRRTAWPLIGWLLAAGLIGCGRASVPLAAPATTTLVAPATGIPAGEPSVSQTPLQPTSTLSAPSASSVAQQGSETQPPVVTPPVATPTAPGSPPPNRTALATPPAHELPRTPPALLRPAPPQVESFRIYDLGAAGSQGRTGAGWRDQYRQDVRAAAIEHLAARLGVANEEIGFAGAGEGEVASAAPCGGPAKAGATGLQIGYEVVLKVGGAWHRYVAVGGSAYYCGSIGG